MIATAASQISPASHHRLNAAPTKIAAAEKITPVLITVVSRRIVRYCGAIRFQAAAGGANRSFIAVSVTGSPGRIRYALDADAPEQGDALDHQDRRAGLRIADLLDVGAAEDADGLVADLDAL